VHARVARGRRLSGEARWRCGRCRARFGPCIGNDGRLRHRYGMPPRCDKHDDETERDDGGSNRSNEFHDAGIAGSERMGVPSQDRGNTEERNRFRLNSAFPLFRDSAMSIEKIGKHGRARSDCRCAPACLAGSVSLPDRVDEGIGHRPLCRSVSHCFMNAPWFSPVRRFQL